MKITTAIGAVCVFAGLLLSQPAAREQAGPLPGGGFLLNSGWKLTPAGKQITVGTFPMAGVLSPDGKYLLVLNCGVAPPSISVIDVATETEASRVPVPDAWLGITFNPKGDRVYVGGGAKASVYEFAWAAGKLTAGRTFALTDPRRRGENFIGDLAFGPDGRMLYVADLYHDSLLVVNSLSGVLVDRIPTGRRPYRILFHPDGKSFFVTSWADGTLTRYQVSDSSSMGSVRLGPHPTDMVMRTGAGGQVIYIAAANTNSVYAVNVPDNDEASKGETINLSLTQLQPVGMTPSALALSADQKTLYVACSNANAVAQVDLSGERTLVAGLIPTGWYPTAVRALPDGRIAVLSGRGAGSYPNPKGPNPTKVVEKEHVMDADVFQYVGLIQKGTVAFVPAPDANQLQKYTNAVMADAGYSDDKMISKPVLPAGIKHVIYIVKENRTYDQVLGDMKEGNGDASLNLFGENVTPNLHKIAREFVLLDNFYVSSDVSADGHNWATSAIANDYVEKLWPSGYGKRRAKYDYEGGEPAALPPAGYLWTNAHLAGITFRNYGYFVQNGPIAEAGKAQVKAIRDPILEPETDMEYRGFDLDYPDVERAKEFASELGEFEKTGKLPQLMFVRMGNDHTSGLAGGKIAPLSAAADNDLGVGMLVEAVSKSRFWNETAIFIIEDDAQNGPDHIDSHRSPAYVISPYVRRHAVDSTMYNTTSVLRTMEAILGLHPMTQFDASARPMSSVFQATPDVTPYTAEKPRTSLDQRNPAKASNGLEARLNLDDADLNDDDELNAQIWLAVKGKPYGASARK